MKLVLQSPVIAALVLVLGLGACVLWMGEHPIRLEHGRIDLHVPSRIVLDIDNETPRRAFKVEVSR